MPFDKVKKLLAGDEEVRGGDAVMEKVMAHSDGDLSEETVRAIQEEIAILRREQQELQEQVEAMQTGDRFDRSQFMEQIAQISDRLKDIAVEEKVDRSVLADQIDELAAVLADREWVANKVDDAEQEMEQRQRQIQDELQDFQGRTRKDIERVREQQRELQEQVESMQDRHRTELEEAVDTVADDLEEEIRGVETGMGERLNTLREQVDRLQDDRSALTEQITELQSETAAAEDVEQLRKRIEELAREDDLAELRSQIEEAQESMETMRERSQTELQEVADEVEDRIDTLEKQVGRHGEKLEGVDLENIRKQVNEELANLSMTQSEIESRLADIEEQVEDVSSVKGRAESIADLALKNDREIDELQGVEERVDTLEKQVAEAKQGGALKEDVRALRQRLNELEEEHASTDELEQLRTNVEELSNLLLQVSDYLERQR